MAEPAAAAEGGDKGKNPVQADLPLGDDKGADAAKAKPAPQDDKSAAKLRAAEEENARLKADIDKRERDDKANKAAKDGKLKEELERTNAELAKAQETNKALAKAARERVERMIEKLPKADQEEIALVKSDLPPDKLEALVERRMTAIAAIKVEPAANDKDKPAGDAGKDKPKAPAVPGVKGSASVPEVGHEIHPETKAVMQKVFAQPPQYEISKHLGVDTTGKFGWERTDDEDVNKANFIHLLNSISAGPTGPAREQVAYDRVLKRAK